MDYINDISESLAVSAFNGTSFSPEKRGAMYRKDYADTLAADYAKLTEQANRGGTMHMLEAEFARYRSGYATRMRAWLHSHSRCMSAMIAGPANFPTRRNQKRNDIEHKRMGELIHFRERALRAITRNLRPDLAPIMAGDADAIERLQDKLAGLERLQAKMKQINAAHKAYQKNPESLLDADLTEQEKDTIRAYKPAYSWEPHPFAPFQLTNNNATIRNTKARIEQLTKAKATPAKEFECADGIRVEDSPPDNRVRVFFPGKPDAEIRAKLKSCGFRWSPTIGAWQAYRNHNAMQCAQSFVWAGKVATQAVQVQA